MTITVKYFGMLTELTQCEEETVTFTHTTVSELLNELFKKYPNLENKSFQIAQNQKLIAKDAKISNTEIALLPPFAGG